MPIRTTHPLATVRNTHGIALPLALMGLVLVSLMVTAVLVTSSTESALSFAQKDAATNLYTSEAAMETYVAQLGVNLDTVTNGSFVPSGGRPMRIDVRRLYLDSVPANNTGEAVFSVRAEPQTGGRAITSMVRIPLRKGVNVSPEAPLVSGAPQLNVTGSSIISGKQNRTLCAEGPDSVDAITLTSDVELDPAKDLRGTIIGDVEVKNYDRYELERILFSPSSLQEMAERAKIRFGIGGTPAFKSSDRVKSDGTANQTNPMATKLNWGCPADVMGAQGRSPCVQDADTSWYPVVAIDASKNSGNKVTLEGDHGQGVLMIINGDLEIRGTFSYKGILIVEGETKISGSSGSSGGAKIEGALIGFGDVTLENPNDPVNSGDATTVTGNAVLSYNYCAIQKANESLAQGAQLRRVTALAAPTFGWSEQVR